MGSKNYIRIGCRVGTVGGSGVVTVVLTPSLLHYCTITTSSVIVPTLHILLLCVSMHV